MHVQYPAYKHSLTQNFGSGKALMFGLSIVIFVGVTCTGCRQESLDEEELKIPAKLSHAYKEEQLEINSDEVKQASKSYTDDEIHPPVHEPPEEHLVKLYNLVKEKKAGQAEAAQEHHQRSGKYSTCTACQLQMEPQRRRHLWSLQPRLLHRDHSW